MKKYYSIFSLYLELLFKIYLFVAYVKNPKSILFLFVKPFEFCHSKIHSRGAKKSRLIVTEIIIEKI